MTESIFDPTGPQTEHSGSGNLGPRADNDSHMPPSAVDGVVEEEDELAPYTSETLKEIAAAEEEEAKNEHEE